MNDVSLYILYAAAVVSQNVSVRVCVLTCSVVTGYIGEASTASACALLPISIGDTFRLTRGSVNSFCEDCRGV
jgi:hypothetical protein